MATTRSEKDLTTSWQEVCSGTGSVQIQGGAGLALVAVGSSIPTDDVGAFGFRAGGLVQNSNAAENIYARTTSTALGVMKAAVWTVA